MRILMTNDDGIQAGGLCALYRRFSPKHEVTVVAPDRQRSAVGHSITLHKPIRFERVRLEGGGFGYAVNGTPADCVKLAVLELFKTKPDLVLSGINPGANVGFNVNYSGTVCAAREAGFYGIPAIAVSMPGDGSRHYDEAAAFVEQVAQRVFENPLPPGTILNVNIPDAPIGEAAGIEITRLETAPFEERFERRMDPRNRAYYWQGCERQSAFSRSDTDGAALSRNCITLTPLRCDLTDHDAVEQIKNWKMTPGGNDGK